MRKYILSFLIVVVAALSVDASGIIKRRNVAPPPPPTVVTDDFNRANENPLDNGVWTTATGLNAMKIVSNTATGVVNGGQNASYYTGAMFASNQYAQAYLVAGGGGGGGWCGIVVRWSGNSGYQLGVDAASDAAYLYRWDSGTQTQVGDAYSGAINENTTIRLEASGTSITLKVGGSSVKTWTDNTYSTGSPGIYQYNSNFTTLDDFEGGDL